MLAARPQLVTADTTLCALDVDDVVLDSLANDELWTVDDVGYNFRHEINVGSKSSISANSAVNIK